MRAAKKAGRRVAMQPSQTPISTARRRASRQISCGPTVSTDTHNMASGELSCWTQTINRQDTPRLPRQQYVVSGAAATLRGIELDWDIRLPPSRTRPHPSTSDLLRDDSDNVGQTRQHCLGISKCVSGYTHLTSFRPSSMMSVL